MLGALALLLASACPNVAGAGALPTTGAAAHGDVDGDGRRDRVTITYARRAPVPCGFFLVVRTATGVRAVRLATPRDKFPTAGDHARWSSDPQPLALADIDRRRGLEIVVRLWRGASSEGGSVFAVAGRRLVLMRIAGSRGDQFDWWGSVAHNGSVDCVGRRRSGLVASRKRAVERDGRSFVEWRGLYRVRGTTFVLIRSATRRGLGLSERWRSDVPDAGYGPPFRRCTVVAGAG